MTEPNKSGNTFQILSIAQDDVPKVMAAADGIRSQTLATVGRGAVEKPGPPISGTKCGVTGGLLSKDDFNCADSDPGSSGGTSR